MTVVIPLLHPAGLKETTVIVLTVDEQTPASVFVTTLPGQTIVGAGWTVMVKVVAVPTQPDVILTGVNV